MRLEFATIQNQEVVIFSRDFRCPNFRIFRVPDIDRVSVTSHRGWHNENRDYTSFFRLCLLLLPGIRNQEENDDQRERRMHWVSLTSGGPPDGGKKYACAILSAL